MWSSSRSDGVSCLLDSDRIGGSTAPRASCFQESFITAKRWSGASGVLLVDTDYDTAIGGAVQVD